jgi:hypothetical protein
MFFISALNLAIQRKGSQMLKFMRSAFSAVSIIVLILHIAVAAEIITGSSTLKLNSPADAAVRYKAVSIAADSLKSSIHEWLSRTTQNAPDLENPIEKHFFNILIKECIKKAKQDSYFEGHEWTLNLDIKDEEVQKVIAAHDKRCDSIAAHHWNLAQDAIADSNYPAIYITSINALFYTMGVISAPKEGSKMENQVREAVQDVLDKLTIHYSSPIIKGKLGEISETQIGITAKIEEKPFPGLVLLARLHNGTRITSLTTDEQGKAELANIKMPFVAYGTFLHVVPNFGAIVNPGYVFEAESFGLSLRETQDQTLIFNVIKPVYSLNYQARAANKVEVPQDFSSDRRLRSFLEDSCHMEPQKSAEQADLELDVRCQVSSYTFDEREETDMKVEVQAEIKQNSSGDSIGKTELLHKKTFDSNHPIPYGLFFWEATNELKIMIREMLKEL